MKINLNFCFAFQGRNVEQKYNVNQQFQMLNLFRDSTVNPSVVDPDPSVLGLPDPDPSLFCTDLDLGPDPSINKQNNKKTLDVY
jgi:hypothetical protein